MAVEASERSPCPMLTQMGNRNVMDNVTPLRRTWIVLGGAGWAKQGAPSTARAWNP